MSDTIADLGEFGLIARVTARFPPTRDVILGPGDDAAVLRAADGRLVATTDLLVEDRHFRRDWSTARDIGVKAAAQNLADVAAMGARPTALLLGLAAPADLPVSWVDGLAEGIRAECDRAGATVAGGDMVGAPAITLAITATGDLEGREPVTRAGARPGDVLALAGRPGLSAAGLALLRAGLDGPAACLDAHRRPRPPYTAGVAAARAGATAMLDVSDGLVQDLGHLATASGVAVDVAGALLPRDPALREAAARLAAIGEKECDVDHILLSGGEDHALVATFAPDRPIPSPWCRIGGVTAGDGVRVDGVPAEVGGWHHFRV